MKNENYKRNVVAYIIMLIRDNFNENENLSYDEYAEELADKFIGGEYDNNSQSLYTCIYDFLNNEEENGTFQNCK